MTKPTLKPITEVSLQDEFSMDTFKQLLYKYVKHIEAIGSVTMENAMLISRITSAYLTELYNFIASVDPVENNEGIAHFLEILLSENIEV